MFNGFWPHYKEWVHDEEAISRPSCSLFYEKVHRNANAQLGSSFGDIDTIGILNNLFGTPDNGWSNMFHHEGDMDEEDSGELGNDRHEATFPW